MLDFGEFSEKSKLKILGNRFLKFPDFFSAIFFQTFFVQASKNIFSELRKKIRYSFDVEIQALSIYDVFRTIPALLPSIQTALVTKGVSKLKHFDEIRWTGYMGSDSRGAHKIDPHTRYGASKNLIHVYSLFINSMRLLKTKK